MVIRILFKFSRSRKSKGSKLSSTTTWFIWISMGDCRLPPHVRYSSGHLLGAIQYKVYSSWLLIFCTFPVLFLKIDMLLSLKEREIISVNCILLESKSEMSKWSILFSLWYCDHNTITLTSLNICRTIVGSTWHTTPRYSPLIIHESIHMKITVSY